MSFHVLPVADLIQHDETDDCPCGPASERVETEDGDEWLVVHHSLDGRERYETAS